MTRRVLCIMLCIAMAMSLCIVPVCASDDYVPTVTDGYILHEEFDNADTPNFTATPNTKTPVVENDYVKVEAANKNGVCDLNAPDIASFTADKYTVEFTVRKEGDAYIEGETDYVIGFGICRAKNASSTSGFAKFGLVMPFGDLDNGVTRTYKFTVDETAATTSAAFSDVSVQDDGAEPQTLTRSTKWWPGHWQEEKYSNYIGIATSGFSIRTVDAAAGDEHGDLVLYIENVKIYEPKAVFANSVSFNEGITDIPDSGEITPVFDMVNLGSDFEATAITAIYDKNGTMTDYNTEYVNVATGEIRGATVDAGDVPHGGRVEAMLWKEGETVIPLAPTAVLGTADSIGMSDSEYLAYSTFANTITIEDTRTPNERVAVTVKDETDNVLAYTQFDARNDGSFKKTIAVEPQSGSEVTVEVSSATETTPEIISNIAMTSNWADFKADFESLNGDSVESFFANYQDNFNYYDGISTRNDLELGEWTETETETVEFLLSTKELSDLTYKDIVTEMTAVGNAVFSDEDNVLDDVEDFVSAVKTALAEEDADALKAYLTNAETKKWINFVTEDVANLDKICGNLLTADKDYKLSESDGIEDIYNKFNTAKEAQLSAETAALADFKAISSEADLAEYFENEDHRENLNITKEYSAKDYAVMYIVYAEMGYGPSIPDGNVVGAITFLQNYIEEYNTWVAAVESKGVITEKWEEVSKVLGTAAGAEALEFVTPELADSYVFADAENEPAIYDIVKYVGYDSLSELSAAINGVGGSAKLEAILGMVTLNSTYTINKGFKYSFDFGVENDKFVPQSSGALAELTEDNTGRFWRFTAPGLGKWYSGVSDASIWLGTHLNTSAEVLNVISPNSEITLDVRYQTKGVPFTLFVAKDKTLYNPDGASVTRNGLSIALFPRETGKWYTYKIALGNFDISTSAMSNMKVYVKERGEADSKYTEITRSIDLGSPDTLVWNNPSDPNNMDNFDYGTNVGWTGLSTGQAMHIGYSTYKSGSSASWTEEVIRGTVTDIANLNINLANTAIADSGKFVLDGKEVIAIPESGTVTPVFTAETTCKPAATAVSVTAVYDANGNMVSKRTKNVQIDYGTGNVIEGAAVDAEDVPEGGRIEAMLWNNETEMKPLIDSLVLGKVEVVEASSAESLACSTYANTVTIEGKEGANKAVTVKIVDGGDNVLAYTQFNATADGSFKKTVTVNPKDGSQVTIYVSTAEKATPDSMTVPMCSNWDGLKADFLTLTKNNAEAFFENYEENFTYTDIKGATKKIIDVSKLSASDKEMIGFLASTFAPVYNENSKITEIIDKLAEITNNLDSVDVLMSSFAAERAKAETEGVEGIKTLITSDETKKFIYFNPEGFLNMDNVCKVLFASTATNIETDVEVLYAEYIGARNNQATAEEAIIPEFKAISSGNKLQSFFRDNAITLGIGKRIAGYTSEDYNVMYAVYHTKGYQTLVSYSEINEAMTFLMNYIDEYKVWTDAVDSAKSATAQWDALKKVFGESAEAEALTYVTPELVDAYGNEKTEPKLYKRIMDIDSRYTSLDSLATVLEGEDGSDVLAEIVSMMACIDDINDGANKAYGKETGYWGWVKSEVEEAVENGWITIDGKRPTVSDAVYNLMLAKPYSYLSDIETNYNAARKDANNSDSNGGGSGGGSGFGGSTSNGSDGKVTAGNGATEGNNDGINIGATETVAIETNKDGHPIAPFTDITAEYGWAKEKITTLREFGILNGDGNGKFRPGDTISREEFLKILLGVFEIEITETEANFTDVKKGDWYNDVVATACKLGIVNGYPDGSFGVGDEVLRADMAVMIVRALNVMGVDIETTEKGFVFKDYTEIPDYAYNAVVKLQQAGLVQGDDYGKYHPMDKLTRAEAAVALHAIFTQLSDMYFYSWNSELYTGSYRN